MIDKIARAGGGFLRIVFIATLLLLLLIPVTMVRSMVQERRDRAEGAARQEAAKWGGSQQRIGAIRLDVPVSHLVQSANGKQWTEEEWIHIWPDTLRGDVNVSTEQRKRGIYPITLWTADNRFSGSWKLPSLPSLGREGYTVLWSRAEVHAMTGNPLALSGKVNLSVGGKGVEMASTTDPSPQKISLANAPVAVSDLPPGEVSGDQVSGSNSAPVALALGGRIALPAESKPGDVVPFEIDWSVRGQGELDIAPIAGGGRVHMKSTWRDPSFCGSLSPVRNLVGTDGFTADWEISSLNLGVPMAYFNAMNSNFQVPFAAVKFREAVDTYDSADRSIKYAVLFLVLMFTAFFLFETFLERPMHPVQYALVGLACCMFYLLTLAFSEHVGFDLAYLIASVSTTLVVVGYISSVLGGWLRAILLGLGMGGLHGFVWTLLKAEDLSLLMGSVGLFAILAGVMWLTRKVQWQKRDPVADDEGIDPVYGTRA